MSVASNWEITIKHGIGKLSLPADPHLFIPEQRRLHEIESLPVTEESLSRLPSLPRLHRDPFDRLLISQALEANLAIVTADPAFAGYGVPVLKAA